MRQQHRQGHRPLIAQHQRCFAGQGNLFSAFLQHHPVHQLAGGRLMGQDGLQLISLPQERFARPVVIRFIAAVFDIAVYAGIRHGYDHRHVDFHRLAAQKFKIDLLALEGHRPAQRMGGTGQSLVDRRGGGDQKSQQPEQNVFGSCGHIILFQSVETIGASS